MKIRVIAECEIPDEIKDPEVFTEDEMRTALKVLNNEYPNSETVDNIKVISVEVITSEVASDHRKQRGRSKPRK